MCLATLAVLACAPARAEEPGEAPTWQSEPAAGQAILNGYRRYNSVCSHCHGPDGIGSSFAPSLIAQPLPFARFAEIVEQGSARGVAVMRGFADDPNVAPHVRDIWRYLAARADGRVGRGRPALAP